MDGERLVRLLLYLARELLPLLLTPPAAPRTRAALGGGASRPAGARAAHGRLTMACHAHPSSHGSPTLLRAAAQPGTHVAVGGAATQ